MKRRTLKMSLFIFAAACSFCSCKKGDDISQQGTGTEQSLKAEPAKSVNAVNASWTINWNNRVNGATYTQSMANTDFGNTTTWYGSGGAYTTNGNGGTVGSRVTLQPNLDDGGGLIANSVIAGGTAYEMDYDVKFHSQFNWERVEKSASALALVSIIRAVILAQMAMAVRCG